MAAPRFRSVPPTEHARYYESPEHVPDAWVPGRPGEIDGFQPSGPALGSQGPDQGFALTIAERLRPKVITQSGENVDDVIRGCLGVALRRAEEADAIAAGTTTPAAAAERLLALFLAPNAQRPPTSEQAARCYDVRVHVTRLALQCWLQSGRVAGHWDRIIVPCTH